MPNIRLYQFPSKTTPVPADIIYGGDSAAAFNEVQMTISGIIGAYPSLLGIGGLTLGNNSFAYVNGSGVYTAGTITPLAVTLLADSTTGAMQSTLGLAIGTNVEAWSAALDALTNIAATANAIPVANGTIYTAITPAASSILISSAGDVPSWSQTLPSAVQTNITKLGAQSQALSMGGFQINNLATPTASTDAATKGYADTIASGLNPIPGAAAATTVNLNATYNNGTSGVGATLTNAGAQAAFVLDGYTASSGDRILVKNQSTSYQNGIYTLTTVGSGAANWVLTRAADYNTPAAINPGDLIAIENGGQMGSSWLETATVATIGSSAITFSVFFTPSSYLQVSNNLSDVASASTSRTNLGLTANAIAAIGQLPGTTTNDNASAGNLGEYLSSVIASGSAISLSNNTAVNVTSLPLTAGDWDVWGNISFTVSTGATNLYAWSSQTSATPPDLSLYNSLGSTGGTLGTSGISIPFKRYSFASTTTIYLTAEATFSAGTVTACGGIYARRPR